MLSIFYQRVFGSLYCTTVSIFCQGVMNRLCVGMMTNIILSITRMSASHSWHHQRKNQNNGVKDAQPRGPREDDLRRNTPAEEHTASEIEAPSETWPKRLRALYLQQR
ncbi:hypothetical protein EL18_00620 [Nitratireductor basaltis]|uniref:Uncharacterized protein n=1 Tax=Nitratireductor basaltis TaxID=472175 RepID=A0A084U9G8_9HYPH|nr:hypothetical protein EL18_00620 [Nitratireductor basaltis]